MAVLEFCLVDWVLVLASQPSPVVAYHRARLAQITWPPRIAFQTHRALRNTRITLYTSFFFEIRFKMYSQGGRLVLHLLYHLCLPENLNTKDFA